MPECSELSPSCRHLMHVTPPRRSFGKVYQGWWRGGVVAIKVVPHDGDLGEKVEIVRESLLSSAIQHPQIVRFSNPSIPPLHPRMGSCAWLCLRQPARE